MMFSKVLAAGAAAIAVAFAGYAVSQTARPAGYLASPVDGLALLTPPPAPESAQAAGERALYEATRTLAGTPRWTQAIADAELTPNALGRGFGCAVGLEISPTSTPALTNVLSRVGTDIGKAVSPPKDHYQRPRPAVGNEAPICVAREPALLDNGSYPSGHAMLGWAYALILAELVPGKADAVLKRGREFGDSRVICGVHYPSDVEAGRTLAAALVARLHAEPQFVADMAAAKAELAKSPPAASCPTPGATP